MDTSRDMDKLAVNVSEEIEDFPHLKEAIENLGKTVTLDEQESADLRYLLNGSRYITYLGNYYRINFYFEDIKVTRLDLEGLCLNISNEEMKKFPYLKKSIETQEGVKMTYKEHTKIWDFLHHRKYWIIKRQNECYEVRFATA